jgi:NAD(P)-dependent dehydrogenase (short-subunit alcohol dehydrogenase family)
MAELAGKVAIVTGASRGIGAAAAFVLAKAGVSVMRATESGHRGSPRKSSQAAAEPQPWHVTSQITDRLRRWSTKPSSG